MFGASSMLASNTFTLTTLSSEEPAASSTSLRLQRICRVSLAAVPRTGWPDCKSTATRPDTKRKSPPLATADAAWPLAFDARGGRRMASWLGLIEHSTEQSGGSDHVELDLKPGLGLRRPHSTGGRSVDHIFPINAVEHIVLDTVVYQSMHLHEAIERRTGRFQQQSQISENDVRLAGKRTMPPLSCFGVDCQHAGAKDEAAGTDCRRL